MGTIKAAVPHLSSGDAATRRSSVMLVNSLAQMGTFSLAPFRDTPAPVLRETSAVQNQGNIQMSNTQYTI